MVVGENAAQWKGRGGAFVGYNVLVVDDYEPWRRRVCSELEKSGRWRIAAELTDGDAAVREARAIKPDVIVLDIGLETLNGVEAARRILGDNPAARILFLTGQNSAEIAEAALDIGAAGYLTKTDAGGRLLLAVETVAAGARFISPSLAGRVVDVVRRPSHAAGHRHDAVFHVHEAPLLDDYARFAESALASGQTVIAVADRARLLKIEAQLEARGVALGLAVRQSRYREVDTAPALAALVPDGRADFETALRSALAVIETARSSSDRRVALFGEMAPQAWRDGHAEAALTLERAWDAAVRTTGADVLCGYLIDGARLGENGYAVFRDICGAHGDVHVH
jgi:DNA-binding NarL/FixJ family response regulator